ncbi:hypothetical protein K431DRAFT_287848 [Polychaeton citri CBS 116435]|uniref:RING-type domain-containing protein n=1 Tax=Polychaeton citri CBS 116435 TaxID=1314669 RepID=A0A9P4Q564_9PEZI|nr:hypothetical protein K431DRAFT_287848 [Polychaeton citri CBS 116435]
MAEQTASLRNDGGILHLEKELSCSICTDVLYQPLTLLDCLHTFCGSCLREWFSWQAASVQNSRRRVEQPYTCPSCRASVRATRPNASVTSLLDVFLNLHPDKGKSEGEKEEIRKQYKHGDNVMPRLVFGPEEEHDSDDERLLQRVRDISLAGADADATRRARRRDGSRQRAGNAGGPQDPQPLHQRRHQQQSRDMQNQAHSVEHQPSLRSLLSASEVDSQEVQEEIMQSILADGILENIDLDNLTAEQEDELTERIAQAYRRQQQQRDSSRNRSRRRDDPSPQSTTSRTRDRSRHHARTASGSNQSTQNRPRPPISRPHLFEQTSRDRSRTRSSSSHAHPRARSSSRAVTAPTQRSATDLTDRPRTESAERERRRRLSSHARSATNQGGSSAIAQPARSQGNAAIERPSSANASPWDPPEPVRVQPSVINNSEPSLLLQDATFQSSTEQTVRPVQSHSAFAPEPVQFAVRSTPSHSAFAPELVQSPPIEPSISCNRCRKAELQYDLHYHCTSCANGEFNLCLPCYREGKGCEFWFGFGYAAFVRWHRMANSQGYHTDLEPPHILNPRRYSRRPTGPAPYPERPGEVESGAAVSHPEGRLKEGAFCERCLEFSNGCYWHCGICLEGAWGYCNSCVQTGRHCMHPLTAIAHRSTMPDLAPRQQTTQPDKAIYAQPPNFPPQTFVPLPVSTDCDLCHRAISPNNTRLHCYQCSDGDYDICQDCYRGLEVSGKIPITDGMGGWRRCPQGHRMAIIGFQDAHGGASTSQQRITVRPIVGGWALKEGVDDDTRRNTNGAALNTAPLPPDGGVGLRCLAIWSYWPEQESHDELAFPRHAEITEVEDINGDWYWGAYASEKGVFPSNHVRVVRS